MADGVQSGVGKAFQDVVTNANGDHDVGRWSWVICTALVALAAGGDLWLTHTAIGVRELAEALTMIAVGHGVALGAKGRTEVAP